MPVTRESAQLIVAVLLLVIVKMALLPYIFAALILWTLLPKELKLFILKLLGSRQERERLKEKVGRRLFQP